MPEREMTYGEKAVGLRFNPSGDKEVAKIKELYAEIIDILKRKTKCYSSEESGEHRRLASIAITQAQQAQMRAVKALTWKD